MSTLLPTAQPRSSSASVQTLDITLNEHIVASTEIVWESILELLGPLNNFGPNNPAPMVLEPFPGGRWFRDLGNGRGNFWGHVQVIKPPTLLEITGPLFMSYAATSHVSYRLTAEGPTTKLALKHTAIGLISDEHASGVTQGWGQKLQELRERAEGKASKR